MCQLKIRKFFKKQVHQIEGPKGKINFLGDKIEITEAEAQKALDDYFDNHPKEKKAAKVKAEAWTLILNGDDVSFNGTCLSSKIYKTSEKRIVARTA